MNQYAKYVIIGFLAGLIIMCLCYLLSIDLHSATVFIAQSVLDNAIFCAMFIAVVMITGISC